MHVGKNIKSSTNKIFFFFFDENDDDEKHREKYVYMYIITMLENYIENQLF